MTALIIAGVVGFLILAFLATPHLMRAWERLPEAIRWVLYLPALLAMWLFVTMPVVFLLGFRTGWAPPLAQAALTAGAFFPFAVFMAPRARVALGWAWYVVWVAWCLVMLVPQGQEAIEVLQFVTRLVAATYSFRWCLREHHQEQGMPI